MAIQPVPPLDDAPVPGPQRGDESTFDDRMDASIRWQETAPPQFRAIGQNVKHNAEEAYGSAVVALGAAQSATTSAENALDSEQAAAASAVQAANGASSLKSTSTTMLALGTGNMAFSTQPGKSYVPGQPMRASDAADLSRRVDGEVFSYNGANGALVLTSNSYKGSGVVSNWVISITGAPGAEGPAGGVAGGSLSGALNEKKGNDVASAATVDPWNASGNYFTLTGSVQITNFANAPQAGARRRALVADSPSIVSGTDLIVKGGSTFFAPGDEVDIYAETTSRFRVTPVRVDYFFTGDTISTARALASPTWLVTDGGAYAKSAYPALAALIGSAFDAVKQSDPATMPTGGAQGLSFSPDSVYMAVAHATTPFVTIYKRVGTLYTKLANPAQLPASDAQDTAFSSDGVYMAVGHSVSPFVTIYKRAGDVFTKLSNPASLPAAAGLCVAFSADTNYLFVGQDSPTVPFSIYKRSGDVFTKLADPSSFPGNRALSASFSPDGTYLAVGSSGTPTLVIYKRAGDVFTRLTDVAVPPSGNCYGVSFSPDGNYIAASGSTTGSAAVNLYKRSGDTFTKMSTPATAAAAFSCAFSPDGNTVALGGTTADTAVLYRRDGDVLTKLPALSGAPAGTAYGVSFSPDGTQVVYAYNFVTPYLAIYARSYDPSIQFVVPSYQPSANSLKNYIRT